MIKTPAKPYANYQDLLKTIAIVAMIIDHIGFFILYPEGMWMRAIGRCVMPIFCFYVGYNFTKPKHIIGLLGCILTSMNYVCFGAANAMINILVAMYLGQWYLHFADKWKLNSDLGTLMQCLILLALTPLVHNYIEYGTLGLAFMVIGKRAKEGGDYRPFIPFVGTCAMIFAMTYFGDYFSLANIVLAILVVFSACLALSAIDHKAPIPVDLRIISRHTLSIYFVNYGGHLVWFYYTYLGLPWA